MNGFVLGASFLGTFVEFVEALTIVLAVLLTKGWKSAFVGAVGAVLTLIVLIAVFGYPLVDAVRLSLVQFIVGVLMLLFGTRWLRKAILRYSGYKALHNEGEAFTKELARQQASGRGLTGIDPFGAMTAFNGVFLEGLEAVFIVITVGLSAGALSSAVFGSFVALAAVVVAGVLFRKPLQAVPENALKFIVGVLMTAFGTFWVGEGLGIHWWAKDLSLPIIAVFYLAASLAYGVFLRAMRRSATTAEARGADAHR